MIRSFRAALELTVITLGLGTLVWWLGALAGMAA